MSNNPRLLENAIENASKKTQFNTTYFEIYDRSIDNDTCDRLIIVQPFQWHIWAINGSVYLLNESNASCPINYTPAILVPKNKSDDPSKQVFNDLCINKVYNTIIVSYTDKIQPVIVDFNIEDLQQQKNKFTIIDALNFLFTKYITMKESKDNDMKYIIKKRFKNIENNFSTNIVDYTTKNKLTRLIRRLKRNN